MKTIAKQLKIKDFPFVIKDKDGKEIYQETSTGYWAKSEYDAHGNEIYQETSTGYWSKREYDAHGKEIYYEASDGIITDKRPKRVEFTTADKLAIAVKALEAIEERFCNGEITYDDWKFMGGTALTTLDLINGDELRIKD
jgi:hypothetical protein